MELKLVLGKANGAPQTGLTLLLFFSFLVVFKSTSIFLVDFERRVAVQADTSILAFGLTRTVIEESPGFLGWGLHGSIE